MPATLAFELMNPAHPIVNGVLDQRVGAQTGHSVWAAIIRRIIDVSRLPAHRPFG